MAYKTILVCLNELTRIPQLLTAARQLGTIFEAHITGLYVIPGVEVYPNPDLVSPTPYDDSNRRKYEEKLSNIRAEFEAAMKKDGLSFDFHEVDAVAPQIAAEVAKEARAADLILVSATSRDDWTGVESDFVERLVIAAGTPVLILPFKGDGTLKLDGVVLGWDNGREASRTAFDAVPLLKLTKCVHIVTVDAALKGTVPGASIAEALDRHGIKSKTVNASSDGLGIGETLIRAARDYGASMIVMGAYGHSRFTEFIFGGATRDIVQNLDRPIFMSH